MRIGTLFGIGIFLDWSVVVIFALLVFQLGARVFPTWHPEWSSELVWGVAFAAAVVFMASIVVHELAHSLVGRRFGIVVRRITLFIFGGVATMENEPPSPAAEGWMAIAGPLASLGLGVLSIALVGWIAGDAQALLYDDPEAYFAALGPTATLLAWVGPINLLLGVFNLIPGFPLDGGRILRALLWWIQGDLLAATRSAATVGRVIAWLMIGSGVAAALGIPLPGIGGGVGSGLWLIFLGFFLSYAARESYRQVVVEQLLDGVTVGRIMQRRPVTVDAELPVGLLVDTHLLGSDARAFPVVDGAGGLVGLVCLEDLRGVARDAWRTTPVAAIMTKAGDLELVSPHSPAVEALRQMVRRGVGQLPVVEGGQVVGLLRRHDVLRWLELHAGAASG